MKSLTQWCTQLACFSLAVVSIRVALVERARSIETPTPKALVRALSGSTATQPTQRAKTGAPDVWGVSFRFIDHLGDAEIDVPDFAEPRIASLLKGYWRRVHSPFIGPQGDRARLVQQVGIASNRSAPSPPPANDGHWHADPRLWGLDEGTYDQREAIVAPAPSHLKWRVALQENSRLQTSIATFAGEGETQFEIALTSGGKRNVLLQKRVSHSRAWDDISIDLSAYRGNAVLELATIGRDASLAAWGSPVIVAPGASTLPYNVLFVVVDAMRSDALASAHDPDDDARLSRAPLAPFDAWLPRMPEVAPNLDRLAAEGTTFVRAWSAAMWTRPSTLAMLTGVRAGRLGLPILELEPKPAEIQAFYAFHPPLWPLMMRERGAATRAIINNMYLCGYVGVGVDTGFEAMTDHRYQVSDTDKITADTVDWLRVHRNERFALFLNYVSPHAPYVPESDYLGPIEHASPRPDNRQVRRYLGEIRKDDAAIGRVVDELKNLGLSSNTIVIVTADHGEALSQAHDWVAVDVAKGVHSGRFTHLSTMWEEAARVPLLVVLPGVVPAGKRVTQHAQTTDIVPTLLDLLSLETPKEIDGVSLRPLWSDKQVTQRSVLIEGRGATSIIDGQWHYIQRSPVARHIRLGNVDFEKAIELYDLNNDPGERQDVAGQHPDVVTRLKEELKTRLGSHAAGKQLDGPLARVHVRVSTGKRSGELIGDITTSGARLVALSRNPLVSVESKSSGSVRVAGRLPAGMTVDLELSVEPATANIEWNWQFGGASWPKAAYHVGPLGLVRDVSNGLRYEDASMMLAKQPPYVSDSQEEGIFVTRNTVNEVDLAVSEAAQAEAQQAMQAWGYVRRSETTRKQP